VICALDNLGKGAAGQAVQNVNLLFGFAEHQMETTYLGSSTGLRLRHDPPVAPLRDRLDHRVGAERGQAVMERCGGLASGNRRRAHEQHRPGVEPRVHLHDGDTGFRVAGLDRARDRCGAAPARQQRCVDVETTELRHVEHGLREDETVGHDHHELRRVAAQPLERLG